MIKEGKISPILTLSLVQGSYESNYTLPELRTLVVMKATMQAQDLAKVLLEFLCLGNSAIYTEEEKNTIARVIWDIQIRRSEQLNNVD